MGFLRIATIPPERAAEADCLMRSVTHTSEGVTCRTWVLEAVRRLTEAGIVRCRDLASLEAEAKAFGFAQFDDTERNVQPRPIVDSCVCSLEMM